MLPTVVEDLIENTDKTLKAITEEVIDPETGKVISVGTYTPGQEPTGKLTYDEWMASEDPDGDLQINPYSGHITEKTIGERYAMDKLGAGPDLDQTPLADADVSEYYAEETASALDKLKTEAGWDVSRGAPTKVIPKYSQEQLQGIEAGAEKAQAKASLDKIGKTRRIRDVGDPMGEDFDPSQVTPTKGIPEHVPMASGAEGAPPIDPDVEAPITPEIPDAEPDLMGNVGKYGGKTLNALQTVQDISTIGKVLTDEEASDEDKALAGTRGVKMLADMAAKKAGQKTASQIASKALTRKGYEELSKTGVKMGGKAAVGTAAGGLVGGYTAVTEAKAAGESWEEGDYDEAILHGIGSVSGGLQTVGAGMMLTGVGAPIGAVLYGVGTAASAISSGALLLEGLGLFGGDDTVQEVEKPKFDAGRYLDTIRQREIRSYY